MTVATGTDAAIFTNSVYRARLPSPIGSVGSSDGGLIPADAEKFAVVREQVGRVVALKRLERGWNLGAGDRVSDSAIATASALVADVVTNAYLLGDVIPLESGAILLEWNSGPRRLQVEVSADGSSEYSLSLEGELHAEGHLFSSEFAALRQWLAGVPIPGAAL